jgi:hypothetical protein
MPTGNHHGSSSAAVPGGGESVGMMKDTRKIKMAVARMLSPTNRNNRISQRPDMIRFYVYTTLSAR